MDLYVTWMLYYIWITLFLHLISVPNAGSALGLGTLNEAIEVEGAKINPGDFFHR